jgi:hypothetical protein
VKHIDAQALWIVGGLAALCLVLAFIAMAIDRTPAGVQAALVFIAVVSNVVTGILAYMKGQSNAQVTQKPDKPIVS